MNIKGLAMFRPWWLGIVRRGGTEKTVMKVLVDDTTGEALQDEQGRVWVVYEKEEPVNG